MTVGANHTPRLARQAVAHDGLSAPSTPRITIALLRRFPPSPSPSAIHTSTAWQETYATRRHRSTTRRYCQFPRPRLQLKSVIQTPFIRGPILDIPCRPFPCRILSDSHHALVSFACCVVPHRIQVPLLTQVCQKTSIAAKGCLQHDMPKPLQNARRCLQVK